MRFPGILILTFLMAGVTAVGTRASAQELAPIAVENLVYMALPSDVSLRPQVAHSAFLAGGVWTPINISGVNRVTAAGTYTWTKTGPASAVLTYQSGAASSRLDVTFSSTLRGTYRETISGISQVISGEISFGALPLDRSAPLVNVSVRSTLVAGQPSIAGFVVSGTGSQRVLIRAVGPTLAQFGVTNAAATPSLTVFKGSAAFASNNGWGTESALSAAFTAVGAFTLPAGSRDCALVLTLAPGDYTAQVTGEAGKDVLTEIYLMP